MWRKRNLLHISLVGMVSVISGCSSISSTPVTRTDGDHVHGDSNGWQKWHDDARPFKGVPITLRVPTHLDVFVYETYFLEKGNDSKLHEVRLLHPCLDVEAKLIESEKIFTVDLKRPLSGSLDYKMEFGTGNNSQYFDKITSDIKENTIKDVSTAISSVVPTFAKLTSGNVEPLDIKGNSKSNVMTQRRTIAWKRFDLDASDFEEQVRSFAETHINCCQSCQSNAAGWKP